MAKRGRKPGSGNAKKKDPFDALPDAFKDNVHSMDNVQLGNEVKEIALKQMAISIAKQNDLDLSQKQEEVKVMSETYSIPTKENKLKLLFLRQTLSDRGQPVYDKSEEPMETEEKD